MTAIPARRKRVTVIGLIVGLLGVGAAGGLAYAGLQTMYDSRAGRLVTPDGGIAPTARLPYTATALVATVDDEGWLTTVEVLAIEPDGSGGSIISVSPSADVASGNAPVLEPLNASFAADGAEALLSAAEGLTGLTFDVAEIVDQERFAALLAPLGELTVDLPTELRDASSGLHYDAGIVSLSPQRAAEAAVATDPSIADWYLDPARSAIWAAVADRVGAGIGTPGGDAGAVVIPRTLDDFLARMFTGRVEHRRLGFVPINAERVAAQLDEVYVDAFAAYDDATVAVVAHDRAETLLVLGAVAPARLGAPLEGPTFRVLSHFEPGLLEPLGVNNADVARQAINRLLFAKVNVVSFGHPEEAPLVTVIEVSDPDSLADVEATYSGLFGGVDVRVATDPIAGVDVQVTLGLSFLDTVQIDSGQPDSPPADTAPDDPAPIDSVAVNDE